MKNISVFLSLTAGFIPLFAADSPSAPATLIEQRIRGAREAIAKSAAKPSPDGYNELAVALVRRARETADPKYCEDAQQAVDRSLQIAPDGFEGHKAAVVVRACQQRWADSLELATALNKKVPDDNPLWGYIANAQMALGHYPAAERAAQQMIDMRQVNPPALQIAARLRELFGFNDPALDFWNSSLRLTSATDVEERAWILTRIARLDRILGRNDAAASAAQQALALEPDYPWALDELARNLASQKKYAEAVAVFTRRLHNGPGVSGMYELGLAQLAAGQQTEAQITFAAFEKQALSVSGSPANADLNLIRYYAGPGRKPADALRIARAILQRQQDVDTLEAYASALAAQGDFQAAGEQMALALKPGIKDPAWFLEAGRIAQKGGDASAAHKYFQQALEAAPGSPLATEVINALTGTPKAGS